MWNIKINYCFLSTFIFSTILSTAYSQGIKFEKELTWQQVKEKAKIENKYIFVDCFATWCAPCKQMDKEVYSSEKVGAFLNDRFISVKLQMDTTKQDDEQVRNRRPIAASFLQQYKVNAFPTYLFFSLDGKIVNKQVGYYKEADFLTIAKNSLNPDKQYYTLLENYKTGKKDYSVMANLASKAKYLGDEQIANNIALDYMNSHLNRLKGPELYTKENITFIEDFIKIDKKFFDSFYRNRGEIDAAMDEKRYAQNVIDAYIYSDLIYPVLKEAYDKKKEPDWDSIIQSTKKKYGTLDADRNVLASKIKWNEYKKNWIAYSKVAIELVRQYKENLSHADLNGFAWNIFQYINDTALLNTALNWSTQAIELSPSDFAPNYIDTKANLLYKLGKTHDAIMLEENAIKLANEQKNDAYVNEFTKNITKMKKGEPTWAQPGSAMQ